MNSAGPNRSPSNHCDQLIDLGAWAWFNFRLVMRSLNCVEDDISISGRILRMKSKSLFCACVPVSSATDLLHNVIDFCEAHTPTSCEFSQLNGCARRLYSSVVGRCLRYADVMLMPRRVETTERKPSATWALWDHRNARLLNSLNYIILVRLCFAKRRRPVAWPRYFPH